MADWTKPALTDTYANFLSSLTGRDVDAYTMAEAPTTPPTGAIRYLRAQNKFQEWSGVAWVDLILSSAGGGTGGTTSLGTMAFQNATGVAITGGSVSASTFTVLSTFNPDTHNSRDIGTVALQFRRAHISGGLLIPVGVDKWVP